MKKWFKRIVISIVVLMIAAFIGVAVFILNFDPSAYKDKLAQMIKTQYNRDLVVAGDIELSLFPRIGLSVENISLTEPGSQEHFAEIDKVRMAVALWPLMSNRFLVDHLAIDGLKANIKRDEQGHYNFEDLLRQSLMQTTHSDAEGLDKQALQQRVANTDFKIDIAGLTLNKGQVHYRGPQRDFVFDDMQVRTGRITQGQPFDLSLSAHATGMKKRVDAELEINGLVLLQPLENTYAFNRLTADIKGKWLPLRQAQANITGSVAINTQQNALIGTDIDVQVEGKGQEKSGINDLKASLTAPTLNYNVSDLSLTLNNFKFESLLNRTDKQSLAVNLDAPELIISPREAGSEPLTGKLVLKNKEQQLDVGFLLEKISGTASELKVDKVSVTGEYRLDNERSLGLNLSSPGEIDLFQQMISLPKLAGEFKLKEQREQVVPLQGSAKTQFTDQLTDFELTAGFPSGEVEVKGYVKNLFHPSVSFDVSGDKVDLKGLINDIRLPLNEIATSHVSSAQKIKAAEQASEASSTSNEVTDKAEAQQGAVASSETSSAQAEEAQEEETQADGDDGESAADSRANAGLTLKQELLSRLSGVGTFNFKQLNYDHVVLNNLGATLLFDHSDVKVKSVRAEAYGGEFLANGEYSFKQKQLIGDLSLNKVQLQDLLLALGQRAVLRGEAQAKIVFSSHGETDKELLEALQAEIEVQAKQGKLYGADLEAILTLPEEYANPWDLSASLNLNYEEVTNYDTIMLHGLLNNQTIFFDKLEMSTPTLKISASPKESVYRWTQDGLYIPAIIKAKKGVQVKKGPVTIRVKSVELPVLIKGELVNPDIKLQLDNLLNLENKSATSKGSE